MNSPELRPSTKPPAGADANDDLRTRVQKSTIDQDRLAASGLNFSGLGTKGPSMRESLGLPPQDNTSKTHGESSLDLERSGPSVNIVGSPTEGAADSEFTNKLEGLGEEEKEAALTAIFPDLKLHDIKYALEKNKGNVGLALEQLVTESFLEETGLPKGIDAFSETGMPSHAGTKIPPEIAPEDHLDEALPAFPPNSNPPCNTIYIRNLPLYTSEDEIKALLLEHPGFKRLMFRTKQGVLICFVGFENVALASEALKYLLGHPHYLMINARLGFSKNPLGVRSGQGITMAGPSRAPDEMRSEQNMVSPNPSHIPSVLPVGPLPLNLPAARNKPKDKHATRAGIEAMEAIQEILRADRKRISEPEGSVKIEKDKKARMTNSMPKYNLERERYREPGYSTEISTAKVTATGPLPNMNTPSDPPSLDAALDQEWEEQEREREQIRQIDSDKEAERRTEAYVQAQDDEIRLQPSVPLLPILSRREVYTKPTAAAVEEDKSPFMIDESGRIKTRKERDEQKPKVKPRRATRPKVKTGCNNCKNRRVKCDETRPQCNKCVRSGKTCDGYPAYKRSVEVEIPTAPRPTGQLSLEAAMDQEREEVLSLLESNNSGYYTSTPKGVNKVSTRRSSTSDQNSGGVKGQPQSARSIMGTDGGTAHRQHIGRWASNGPNGPASLFDNESPFPSATKSKVKKSSPNLSGGDMDDEADDELVHFAPQNKIRAEESDDNEDDAEIIDTEDLSSQSGTGQRADGRQMKRFRLGDQQTQFLQKAFSQQPHPDAAYRERLSREIPGISPRQVQIWFQNRRAKMMRLSADERERLIEKKEVPENFDIIQALQSPVNFASKDTDHILQPLKADASSKDAAGESEIHGSERMADEYYYRRDVREVDPPRRDQEEDFTMARYDRRDVRPRDSASDGDYSDEGCVIRRRVVRQRSQSGGSPPHHKRNLAEGALAGARAAALLATERDRNARQKLKETTEESPSSSPVHPLSQQIKSTKSSSNTPGEPKIPPSPFPTNSPAKGLNEVFSNMQDALDSSEDGSGISLKIQALPAKGRPTPLTLKEEVVKGDLSSVCQLLEEHFNDVAKDEFDWLHELLDIDCSYEEMAKLLIDGETNSPWVLIEKPVILRAITTSPNFHQLDCVHYGGYKVTNTPQLSYLRPIQNSAARTKEVISEYCGLAGISPIDPVNAFHDWHDTSCVKFDNGNSTASITYQDSFQGNQDVQWACISHMSVGLARILDAIGYLQQNGLCCDSITILRITNTLGPIELCKLDVSLLTTFQSLFRVWRENFLDTQLRKACERQAQLILQIFVGDNHMAAACGPSWENDFALVLQCLFLAVTSYIQAHIGTLHPSYLVSELKQIRLFGTQPQLSESKHVVVELLDFSCMRDMVKDPALVFRISKISLAPRRTRFDLLASPEDVADTWGPARFVTDSKLGLSALHAIEIGGGTISRPFQNSDNLHWANGQTVLEGRSFHSTEKILIAGITINIQCPLDETKSWRHPATNAYLKHLGTHDCSWELREKQAGFQGGQYAVLAFNATYIKQNGVTLKQQQLMLPFNEIDLAFLNSTCGLQISFCTGVARRVALRELLADVMVPFVESRLQKPVHWEELKKEDNIVQAFRTNSLDQWFNDLSIEKRECAVQIVRSMLEILKDTGIDKNGEELVIAWVRKESPYSCLRLRCEKTSLWARILADSEDCATFACITPLCLQSEKNKCRHLEVAPWHNVSNLLDTAVCPQLSNRELTTVATTLAPFKLQHQVSYWIGKSGSNMIAKVWLTSEGAEPVLVVRQKVIPEKYRARMPKSMVERLGRLRERQASETIAKQVLILTEMPI